MNLTDDKKALMFKMLEEKPLYETGLEFGLDKHYKDVTAVRNAVYRVYNQVRQNPGKYLLQQDQIDKVVDVVSKRGVAALHQSLREKTEKENTLSAQIEVTKDLALDIIKKKLYMISGSRKLTKEANPLQLAQVFGILFDKSQIMKGQSTENIAIMAKVSKDLTPEEALKAIVDMREANQAEKDRKK